MVEKIPRKLIINILAFGLGYYFLPLLSLNFLYATGTFSLLDFEMPVRAGVLIYWALLTWKIKNIYDNDNEDDGEIYNG